MDIKKMNWNELYFDPKIEDVLKLSLFRDFCMALKEQGLYAVHKWNEGLDLRFNKTLSLNQYMEILFIFDFYKFTIHDIIFYSNSNKIKIKTTQSVYRYLYD